VSTAPPQQLHTDRITGTIGALIDASGWPSPLTEATVEALHQAIAHHGVVVLRGLDLDGSGHLALARQLGEIRVPPVYFPTLSDQGLPEVAVLESPGMGSYSGEWHSDVTWLAAPPRYSILRMDTCPGAGGDTMWASLTDAHDRLSPALREFCATLTAEHSIGDQLAVHPVVHVHPVTGRRSLGVNQLWTRRICELEPGESDSLLRILYDATVQPESTCRWRWQEGDVAIWDNHFVVHYVVQDYGEEHRVIHRIEIEGEPFVPA
jgi:taurine dioxygenase